MEKINLTDEQIELLMHEVHHKVCEEKLKILPAHIAYSGRHCKVHFRPDYWYFVRMWYDRKYMPTNSSLGGDPNGPRFWSLCHLVPQWTDDMPPYIVDVYNPETQKSNLTPN